MYVLAAAMISHSERKENAAVAEPAGQRVLERSGAISADGAAAK
jgi:hypothetical protein